MKKDKSFSLLSLLLSLLMLFSLSACGAQSSDMKNTSGGYTDGGKDGFRKPESGTAESPGQEKEPLQLTDQRKLIRETSLEIETNKFEDLDELVQKETAAFDGYIENSSVTGRQDNHSRSGFYRIRVPDKNMEAFLNALKGTNNVLSESLQVDDITLNYIDTESRIKALETERDTLLEIMKDSKEIEDIIAIQSRLSEIRYELQNYESQKRSMDNRIDFAVVNLSFREVVKYTEVEQPSFGAEAARRFKEGWDNFVYDFRYFVLGLIEAWTFIIILAIILAIAIPAGRKIRRKRKKKKEEKMAKMPPYMGMPVYPNPPGAFLNPMPPGAMPPAQGKPMSAPQAEDRKTKQAAAKPEGETEEKTEKQAERKPD